VADEHASADAALKVLAAFVGASGAGRALSVSAEAIGESTATSTQRCLNSPRQLRSPKLDVVGGEHGFLRMIKEATKSIRAPYGSRSAERPVNRSIRLAIGGWVENRLEKFTPSSGATMNRCAVDGVACIGTRFE
jgi:hypothetical protein